jgi:hypothetical protein
MAKTFFERFFLEIVLLVVYSSWWTYFIYFLYGADYDNNYAGASASIGIGWLTILIVSSYLLGFAIAALMNRNKRRQYLLILVFLAMPVFGVFLVEILN